MARLACEVEGIEVRKQFMLEDLALPSPVLHGLSDGCLSDVLEGASMYSHCRQGLHHGARRSSSRNSFKLVAAM